MNKSTLGSGAGRFRNGRSGGATTRGPALSLSPGQSDSPFRSTDATGPARDCDSNSVVSALGAREASSRAASLSCPAPGARTSRTWSRCSRGPRMAHQWEARSRAGGTRESLVTRCARRPRWGITSEVWAPCSVAHYLAEHPRSGASLVHARFTLAPCHSFARVETALRVVASGHPAAKRLQLGISQPATWRLRRSS